MAITVAVARGVLAEAGFDPNLVCLAVAPAEEHLASALATRPEVRIIEPRSVVKGRSARRAAGERARQDEEREPHELGGAVATNEGRAANESNHAASLGCAARQRKSGLRAPMPSPRRHSRHVRVNLWQCLPCMSGRIGLSSCSLHA